MEPCAIEISKGGHRARPDPRGRVLHLRERMKTRCHMQADMCQQTRDGRLSLHVPLFH